MSLRRAQTVRAIKDRSDSMLIHLGKTYLGQVERPSKPPVDIEQAAAQLPEFDSGIDAQHGNQFPQEKPERSEPIQ
jgi:hypothetical protein